jgi:hypothetical protein
MGGGEYRPLHQRGHQCYCADQGRNRFAPRNQRCCQKYETQRERARESERVLTCSTYYLEEVDKLEDLYEQADKVLHPEVCRHPRNSRCGGRESGNQLTYYRGAPQPKTQEGTKKLNTEYVREDDGGDADTDAASVGEVEGEEIDPDAKAYMLQAEIDDRTFHFYQKHNKKPQDIVKGMERQANGGVVTIDCLID